MSNLYKKRGQRSLKSGCIGQVVFCKTPAGDYFWWIYHEKCFLYSLLLIQSSQDFFVLKVVFYYKGFLQICNKFTGEHPRGNISLKTHLHGRIMLLKGALVFHPEEWLQNKAWLFWESQYVSTSKLNWILRKQTKV